MNNYSTETAIIVEKLIEALISDTESSISFLVNGLHFDEDEINEMGCLDISDKVKEEIYSEDMDIETLKDAVLMSDIEDFDKESFNTNTDVVIDVEGEMRQPCKNPCPTCPYTKKSLSGDFGGNDPEEYANAIHQDTVIACHSRTKHNKTTSLPDSISDVTICTGHIIAQIKVCKSSQHTDGAKAHTLLRENENFEKLKENNLGFDFKQHHGLT
jgi:hypothetical protein